MIYFDKEGISEEDNLPNVLGKGKGFAARAKGKGKRRSRSNSRIRKGAGAARKDGGAPSTGDRRK